MQKVIFLDIDGVLNSHEWYELYHNSRYDKCLNSDGTMLYDRDIDYRSVLLLNEIYKKVPNVGIVITSTWRFDMEDTVSRLKNQGLLIPVIGSTEKNNSAGIYGTCPRGLQIKKWIDDTIYATNDPLMNYVIFDDDTDMLYDQRDNFIHTNYEIGLTKDDVEKAISILRPYNAN